MALSADERLTNLESRMGAQELNHASLGGAVNNLAGAIDSLGKKIEVDREAQKEMLRTAVTTFRGTVPLRIVLYFFLAISISFSAGAGVKVGKEFLDAAVSKWGSEFSR